MTPILSPHLTLLNRFESAGITIVKPKRGLPKTVEGAVYQDWLVSNTDWAGLGFNLLVVDTRTEACAGCIDELAESGVHATSTTKVFSVTDGDSKIKYTTSDRRDYGMAYGAMIEHRNAVLRQPIHYLDLCHESPIKEGTEEKSIVVGFGPNAGGPALAKSWGTNFPAVLRLDVDKDGKRFVQTTILHRNALPYLAKLTSGGKVVPNLVPLPWTFDGQSVVLKLFLEAQGIDLKDFPGTGPFRACFYGLQGSGKTCLAASFWGCLKIAKPSARMVYVAYDGGSEYLRPFWDFLKVVI